jgi:hypothetical protein
MVRRYRRAIGDLVLRYENTPHLTSKNIDIIPSLPLPDTAIYIWPSPG